MAGLISSGGGSSGGESDIHASSHEEGGNDVISVATSLLLDNAVTAAKVDESDSFSWSSEHEWTADTSVTGADVLKRFRDVATGDEARWVYDDNGTISLAASGDSASTILQFVPGGSGVTFGEPLSIPATSSMDGSTLISGGNQSNFNAEDFGTASATSGEVPTAQGDGTLAMQTPSGGSSEWTLDGTFSPGSTSSATYTMSSSYPVIKIVVTDDSSATANNEIDLRINGNSTATYHTSQGSATPSADNFAKEIFHTTYAGGMKIMMAGQWSGNWSGKTMGGENPGHGTTAHEMASTGLTSPLDSFTIFDDAANNYNITADVYGYTG